MKVNKTKAVILALLKSKATYALLGTILTALGFAGGIEVSQKVQALLTILLDLQVV